MAAGISRHLGGERLGTGTGLSTSRWNLPFAGSKTTGPICEIGPVYSLRRAAQHHRQVHPGDRLKLDKKVDRTRTVAVVIVSPGADNQDIPIGRNRRAKPVICSAVRGGELGSLTPFTSPAHVPLIHMGGTGPIATVIIPIGADDHGVSTD